MPQSLYIHIPFCPSICPYCDFHKMRRSEALVEKFLKRLREETQSYHQQYPNKLKTIYLGGGTPSHLSNQELEHLFESISQTWGLDAQEITLEADPLTYDTERLKFFKSLGVNRLSIGLQSTQDTVLKFLGRKHNAKEGLSAVRQAVDTGFRVSADLITAIDGQDTAKDLHTLAQTEVGHISVYNLTIEAHTPFAFRKIQVDEDKEIEDYVLTDEILSSYGYTRYEISSHAKSGEESLHNQVYWHGDYFIALGPSAAGLLPYDDERVVATRYSNSTIKSWLETDKIEEFHLTSIEFCIERLMTGLRTLKGVDIKQLKKRTNIDILVEFSREIDLFVEQNMLEIRDDQLIATQKGLLQLNGIIQKFFRS